MWEVIQGPGKPKPQPQGEKKKKRPCWQSIGL